MNTKAQMVKEAPSPPTVTELKRQCHALIERIGQHPYNTKLLLVSRNQLAMTVNYKRSPGRLRGRSAHKAFDE